VAILDEIQAVGLRSSTWGNTAQVLNTVRRTGTEDQKRERCRRPWREATFTLGFSESAAALMAPAQARAVRDVLGEDGWRINGAQMFTSTSHEASHVILLTRTNAEVPKHRGLTMFLVPLSGLGIAIREIRTLSGGRTYATLLHRRRSPRLGPAGRGRRGLVGYVTLARIANDEEVSRLLQLQTGWVAACGELPRAEGAIAKLDGTEHAQASPASCLTRTGLAGTPHCGAPEHGPWP
jgi:alkylation response protein AidB-like acyl-CoA dehydrogenase